MEESMLYLTMDDIGMVDSEDLYLLDIIKKRMPEMKLTIFVVPLWNGSKPINKDSLFRKWVYINKDWVEVGVHGYRHASHYGIREGAGTYEQQKRQFAKGKEILREFLPKNCGFKSPGNENNEHTKQVLTDLGFAYWAFEEHIIPLGDNQFEDGAIVTSHINQPLSFKFWNIKGNFALVNEGITAKRD